VPCTDLADLLTEVGVSELPRRYQTYVDDHAIYIEGKLYLSASLFLAALDASKLFPRVSKYLAEKVK
jgi:hypothetical protein